MRLDRQRQVTIAYDRAGCDWSIHCNWRAHEPTADTPPRAEVGERPHERTVAIAPHLEAVNGAHALVAGDAAKIQQQPAPPVLALLTGTIQMAGPSEISFSLARASPRRRSALRGAPLARAARSSARVSSLVKRCVAAAVSP